MAKNHTPDMNKRAMIWVEEGQSYGKVERMLGDMRCHVICQDGIRRLCHIRGKFRRRVWINADDVVLVSLRDFQDDKGEIIHKYNASEIQLLRERNHFYPERLQVSSSTLDSSYGQQQSMTTDIEKLLQELNDPTPTKGPPNEEDDDDGLLIDFSTI